MIEIDALPFRGKCHDRHDLGHIVRLRVEASKFVQKYAIDKSDLTHRKLLQHTREESVKSNIVHVALAGAIVLLPATSSFADTINLNNYLTAFAPGNVAASGQPWVIAQGTGTVITVASPPAERMRPKFRETLDFGTSCQSIGSRVRNIRSICGCSCRQGM